MDAEQIPLHPFTSPNVQNPNGIAGEASHEFSTTQTAEQLYNSCHTPTAASQIDPADAGPKHPFSFVKSHQHQSITQFTIIT